MLGYHPKFLSCIGLTAERAGQGTVAAAETHVISAMEGTPAPEPALPSAAAVNQGEGGREAGRQGE